MTDTATVRIDYTALCQGADALLQAAGMDPDKATVVAEVLADADSMGRYTHGVGLLPGYLKALASGEMSGQGSYTVKNDTGSCITWLGNRLPGAWLVRTALDIACERAATHGVVTVAIGCSHHTGALSAYLPRVTGRGLIAEICCATAGAARVAPHGGTEPVVTPNPIAIGMPTEGDPIIIDISASIATTTLTRQLADRGERYPGAWALTADGEVTDDPTAVTERGGTLLPLGGPDKGYKGFGLAMMVDLLSLGLSDFGRGDKPGPMQLGVFLQVIDPDAFGGQAAFRRHAGYLADSARAVKPVPGVAQVRVPGDGAAAAMRDAQAHGVPLDRTAWATLSEHASARGIDWPVPLG